MLRDWWMAHRLEVYLDSILACVLLTGSLMIVVRLWVRRRRKGKM
jgi:hypothetical protein